MMKFLNLLEWTTLRQTDKTDDSQLTIKTTNLEHKKTRVDIHIESIEMSLCLSQQWSVVVSLLLKGHSVAI